MTAMISTMNSAYDFEEGRQWWKVQLTAILLTLGVRDRCTGITLIVAL